MVSNEQLHYVTQQLQAGIDKEELRATLRQSGYSEESIDELLQAASAQPTPPPPHSSDSAGADGAAAATTGGPSASAASTAPALVTDEAKAVAIAGYIVSFLFFLPLVMDNLKQNKYARFHANQHLLLFIIGAGFIVVSNILTSMMAMALGGAFFLFSGIIFPVFAIGILVLMVMGVINAANEKMEPLPLIGHITILK